MRIYFFAIMLLAALPVEAISISDERIGFSVAIPSNAVVKFNKSDPGKIATFAFVNNGGMGDGLVFFFGRGATGQIKFSDFRRGIIKRYGKDPDSEKSDVPLFNINFRQITYKMSDENGAFITTVLFATIPLPSNEEIMVNVLMTTKGKSELQAPDLAEKLKFLHITKPKQ